MLNIKPVLHRQRRKTHRHRKKSAAVKKSLQELAVYDEKWCYHDISAIPSLSVMATAKKMQNYVAEKVKEKYQINTIIMNQVGATIGAHSGPGTMALFFVGDER